MERLAQRRPLSRTKGATPTRAASCLVEIEPISGKRQLMLKAVWKPTPLIEQRRWSLFGDEDLELLADRFDLGLEVLKYFLN